MSRKIMKVVKVRRLVKDMFRDLGGYGVVVPAVDLIEKVQHKIEEELAFESFKRGHCAKTVESTKKAVQRQAGQVRLIRRCLSDMVYAKELQKLQDEMFRYVRIEELNVCGEWKLIKKAPFPETSPPDPEDAPRSKVKKTRKKHRALAA